MKNISKQILALAITPFIACAANAEDSYYAKVEVGLALPQKMNGNKLKKSAIFGIEGGYKMNENFRFGLGIGMLSNIKPKDVPAGTTPPKVSSLFGEANAYYDIGEFNGFTPYLTAGVGVSRNKLKNSAQSGVTPPAGNTGGFNLANKPIAAPGSTASSSNSKTKTNFAWNVGLGAMYNIDPEFAVDLTYRYRDLGKVMKGDDAKLKSHNVTVGLVYKF
ncbi:outer membrane protein [Candidatus Aquarickettsia rohweri]|uniref:Porin family protein n=1 Tax=Candidatus Aquarickettsia rohweri TaxID=2602574 RepID=A0A429XSR8_9RICK|nr:outer membrane beta-barrel protein [Candidatus Aquarickettsia rohweri]RST70090.1 porin family protein [Candidatus Aquarickettsia rohweri]